MSTSPRYYTADPYATTSIIIKHGETQFKSHVDFYLFLCVLNDPMIPTINFSKLFVSQRQHSFPRTVGVFVSPGHGWMLRTCFDEFRFFYTRHVERYGLRNAR